MKKDIKEIISKKNLFSENETIVLALSGGVDSMVLFHILRNLNLNVVIAHINHNKREESFNEFEEIKLIAEYHNVPFEGIVLDKNLNGNFHDESRKRRLNFFYDTAKKYHSNKIVLGHHVDDQLETVLMRLVRGTSFSGYAGIKEERAYKDVTLVRPLLNVSKTDILEYAKDHNVTYFQDQSNTDPMYTRNRFRSEIIPLLKEENPNIEKQINQFTSYIEMADEFIKNKRDEFLGQYYVENKVNLIEFNKLETILKIKVIKFIINSKTFDTVEVSYQQYEDLIEILSNDNPNTKYNLAKGYILVKAYDEFYIEMSTDKESVSLEINAFGEYIVNNKVRYIFSNEKLALNNSENIEIWYNDSVFPLYLRNRENGDKMTLQIGTKKVKDILIDQKIPSMEREALILLASRDKVLWIPKIKKSLQDTSCRNKIFVYEVR